MGSYPSEWKVASDDCGDICWWIVYRDISDDEEEEQDETFEFTSAGREAAQRLADKLNSER